MRRLMVYVVMAMLCTTGCNTDGSERNDTNGKNAESMLEKGGVNIVESDKELTTGLYATFETSEGDIVCVLHEKEAPKTVENFVGLATGNKEWTDPNTGNKVKSRLYDGLIFHRVIPEFMVQGGCPLGNGMGGPGYKFEDEFDSNLRFDQVGQLAMANSGPSTNGSQFFITVARTEHLNDKHTIFGQVVSGYPIAVKISQVPCGSGNKPSKPVVINKLSIKRVE